LVTHIYFQKDLHANLTKEHEALLQKYEQDIASRDDAIKTLKKLMMEEIDNNNKKYEKILGQNAAERKQLLDQILGNALLLILLKFSQS
jgi:hypothetical protein